MGDWMMAHPRMTSFLIVFALFVLDATIANICRVIMFHIREKYENKTKESN